MLLMVLAIDVAGQAKTGHSSTKGCAANVTSGGEKNAHRSVGDSNLQILTLKYLMG